MAPLQPLTKDLVATTKMVQLQLRLSPSALDVVLYNPLEDNSLIHRHIPLTSDPAGYLAALEAAIYDNPLLLSEFARVNILIESTRFLLIPAQSADSDTARRLLLMAHPDAAADDIFVNDIDAYAAAFVTAFDSKAISFLRRTFNNAPIINALVPAIRFFRSKTPEGNAVKALINLRHDSLDIIALSHTSLLLANRFSYADPNDALYYILACAAQINPQPEQLLLCGDRDARDAVTPLLRRFHPYVMPMIFPSEIYRAGADALNAPFDLVIMPLCE